MTVIVIIKHNLKKVSKWKNENNNAIPSVQGFYFKDLKKIYISKNALFVFLR